MQVARRFNHHKPPFDAPPPLRKVIREQKERVELDWLRRNLPVLVQPEIDIKAGHPFQCLFYKFRREGDEVTCEISLVLEGEATWADFSGCCKSWQPRVNIAMTYCYRTWNRFVYERTADINSFIFTGVSFTNKTKPWRSIWTADGSGPQTFAHGTLSHYPCWATICAHYTIDLPFETWRKEGDTHSPEEDDGCNNSEVEGAVRHDFTNRRPSTHGGAEAIEQVVVEASRSPPPIPSSTRPLLFINT